MPASGSSFSAVARAKTNSCSGVEMRQVVFRRLDAEPLAGGFVGVVLGRSGASGTRPPRPCATEIGDRAQPRCFCFGDQARRSSIARRGRGPRRRWAVNSTGCGAAAGRGHVAVAPPLEFDSAGRSRAPSLGALKMCSCPRSPRIALASLRMGSVELTQAPVPGRGRRARQQRGEAFSAVDFELFFARKFSGICRSKRIFLAASCPDFELSGVPPD